MVKLTEQQLQVVEGQLEINTTLNIVAGPKCGKTVSLVNKIVYLLNQGEIKPNEILILSLTNKSVDNVVNLIKNHREIDECISNQIYVSTIHGLAKKIVSNNHKQVVNIIEEHEWQTIRQLLPINNDTVTRFKKNTIIKTQNLETMVRLWKNGLNTSFGFRHLSPLDEDMVQQTIKIMNYCNVMTNDDLIIKAAAMIKQEQSKSYSQYKLILIDDSQDLYPNLVPFIKQLVQLNNVQLCLFHDPNERIFQFMGVNKQVINELLQLNEKNIQYSLTQNFGNVPEIINSATKVLSSNFERTSLDLITTHIPTNIGPQVYNYNDSLKQLDFLVTEICKLITTGVVEFKDIAILSRTNAFMKQIINHLNSYGVPCEMMVARPEWINDLRIQFILNILKIIAMGHTKDVKMCNFPILVILSQLKGIGQKSLFSLYEFCSKENVPIWEYFLTTPINKWDSSISNKPKIFNNLTIIKDNISEEINKLKIEKLIYIINDIIMGLECPLFTYDNKESLEEFKINFKSMIRTLKQCEITKPNEEYLLSYFFQTYLTHDPWKELKENNAITVSTIHSAKSSEFPIVMLANAPPINAQSDFPMDTNTLYTGMTRAQYMLYMININHLMVRSDHFKNESNIALNESFWKYYIQNKSKKSKNTGAASLQYSLDKVKLNQTSIQRKFGIRFLSTLSCKYKSVYRRFY